MLVDNKFIYISLPRRGSTSFHYSCILHNLDIQTTNQTQGENSKIDFNDIDETQIMNYIVHAHEPLVDLKKKFGVDYPIISVKRDRHETFYSLYKHLIFDLKRVGAINVYEHFKNITLDELFFFKTQDLLSNESRWRVINDYLLNKNLIKGKYNIPSKFNVPSEEYIINIINIFMTPSVFWHNNDPSIIWFDFNNFQELENWVSEKINKPFKIKHVNSSKHIECGINLDYNFIEKYNSIYDYYDIAKNKKTLL